MTVKRHRLKIPKRKRKWEQSKKKSMLSELLAEHKPDYIIGIDEVGWGAIAGPLVIGCTVYKVGYTNAGIRDSKSYTEKKREAAFTLVQETAEYVNYYQATPGELELYGAGPMLQTAFKSMADRAVAHYPNSIVIVDGKNLIKGFKGVQAAFAKADTFVCAVSAASVAAKVSRDHTMMELAKEFPEFEWEINKGYPTPKHLEAMKTFGVTKHHRRNVDTVLSIEEEHGEYRKD